MQHVSVPFDESYHTLISPAFATQEAFQRFAMLAIAIALHFYAADGTAILRIKDGAKTIERLDLPSIDDASPPVATGGEKSHTATLSLPESASTMLNDLCRLGFERSPSAALARAMILVDAINSALSLGYKTEPPLPVKLLEALPAVSLSQSDIASNRARNARLR